MIEIVTPTENYDPIDSAGGSSQGDFLEIVTPTENYDPIDSAGGSSQGDFFYLWGRPRSKAK